MPLANLIFFAEPRELTEAQYEEARVGGLLRDEEPTGDPKPVERDSNNPVTGGMPSENVQAAPLTAEPDDTDAQPEETP